MSSHSRLDSSSSYRVPWAFDEEAAEVTRVFTKLNPGDRNVAYLDTQYMLGSGWICELA